MILHDSFSLEHEENIKFFFARTGWDHIVDANTGLHVIHQLSAAGMTSLLAQILAEQPSLVNFPDAKGHTPLHHAVINARLESIKLLVNILQLLCWIIFDPRR